MRKTIVTCLLLGAALAVQACRPEPNDSATGNARVSVPATAPSITGTVTDVSDQRRIRIEEIPGEASGSAKAVVRLTDDAVILTRAGAVATFESITAGARVSAWFTGPVAESYPVQATANVIVIEPAGS